MTCGPSSVAADDPAPATEKNTEANSSLSASTRDEPCCWISCYIREYKYLAQETRKVSCNAEANVTKERLRGIQKTSRCNSLQASIGMPMNLEIDLV